MHRQNKRALSVSTSKDEPQADIEEHGILDDRYKRERLARLIKFGYQGTMFFSSEALHDTVTQLKWLEIAIPVFIPFHCPPSPWAKCDYHCHPMIF